MFDWNHAGIAGIVKPAVALAVVLRLDNECLELTDVLVHEQRAHQDIIIA